MYVIEHIAELNPNSGNLLQKETKNYDTTIILGDSTHEGQFKHIHSFVYTYRCFAQCWTILQSEMDHHTFHLNMYKPDKNQNLKTSHDYYLLYSCGLNNIRGPYLGTHCIIKEYDEHVKNKLLPSKEPLSRLFETCFCTVKFTPSQCTSCEVVSASHPSPAKRRESTDV